MQLETMKSTASSKLLTAPRIITLLGCILVSLGSGTNYSYSAYAPQLGARLHVSHTQLNVIGLAGNMGGSISGPVWGRIVDIKGPRIPLVAAFTFLLIGYSGVKKMYDDGIGDAVTVSALHFAVLVLCGFMTGLGGTAGVAAALNATAKSFPDTSRATTTGLVISGFGLSAFLFLTVAQVFSPGDTSAFLLVLALGTSIPMLVGLFIVRPVPLPPPNLGTRHDTTTEGYNLIPIVDAGVFIADPGEAEIDAEEADSATLLSHEYERSSHYLSEPSSSVEMTPPWSPSRGRGEDKDGMPNIHGKQLWLTPDFYLILTIMGIYINNVGSISQALYAKANPIYDALEASKWQASQVSTLSIGNFAGRILIGSISDFAHNRLHLPRVYCLCIVSCLFIISQVFAIGISSVQSLWMASSLLGLAYGSLFGLCPTIIIEWFGLAHFSENLGYTFPAPLIGGNLFSLMFGRNLDAHVPTDTHSTRILSSLGSRELPSEHQCFDGRECYVGSLKVTMVACVISLGLSVWAGIRDGKKDKGEKEMIELAA
ncbi:MFS general substrate transporter [Paxillus ammoniavirescens]|nr:MFS general substrate transporter [Paxillus ammoniavirescens]